MGRSVSPLRLGAVALLLLSAVVTLLSWTNRSTEAPRDSRPAGAQPLAELDPRADATVADGRGNAVASNVLTVRFSHVTAPETIKHRCALRFKQHVEQQSGGLIQVDVSPDGRAFHDGEELSALQAGLSDVLAVSLPQLARLTGNDFELFGLPYLFEDEAEFRKVVDGPIGRRLFQQLEARGVTGLAYWSNGFQGVGGSSPLRRPSDFAGLRVRVQRSLMLTESFRVLGAKPFVTTFADQVLTLESGAADAAENSLANFVSQKLDRFQPYFTALRHVVLAYGVVVGKVWWDRLSDDQRNIIATALEEATLESQRLARSSDSEAKGALAERKKTTVVELTREERSAFRIALSATYTRATASVRALAQEVVRTLAEARQR